ncbi:hypothetical protein KIL84_013840 [Mauremys mutica]|uniref:Uncharacterized protein n=1 Tax=Mauremys mutica TaxID=74926 RepID=A0A9D3WYF1_9SAUR|nr:hypothetical protein KIL84_013840 [Mauremys mutica]
MASKHAASVSAPAIFSFNEYLKKPKKLQKSQEIHPKYCIKMKHPKRQYVWAKRFL